MKKYMNIVKDDFKLGTTNSWFIYDFLFNSEKPNMIRVHISHDDMDGFGCTFVTKAYSVSPNNIEYLNIHKVSDANKIITDKLHEIMDRLSDNDIKIPVMMLITDLANIDVSIFNEIQSKYIFKYCIIDHHIQAHEDYLAMRYINTCKAASHLYMQAVMTVLESRCVIDDRYSKIIDVTYTITKAISEYDTGHWGDWKLISDNIDIENDFQINIVPLNISLQLYFNYCRNLVNSNNDAGFNFIDTLISTIYSNVTIEDTIKFSVREEFIKLVTAYDHFISGLTPDKYVPLIYVPFTKTTLCLRRPTIAYYLFDEKSDPNVRGYFSFISKEYLENHREVDILLLENVVINEVQLRTAKDNINVAEIAQLNGGGGHQKAAGYPISDTNT